MATTTVEHMPSTPTRLRPDDHHLFDADEDADGRSYQHRFSRFDLEPLELANTTSPSQIKRAIEAHLQENDRRLLEAQKLGNALLKERENLTSRLEEVDQLRDEAEIPVDLRKRLADIDREHTDVAREVARALIGPKIKPEDSQLSESSVFASQATGSPTKISAPSRRHRNQASTRAGDLQFAADISTSLLAQVRQLQAGVAERDETIKRAQAERESADHDILNYTQKIRTLDESEQRFKDENWTLETQNHELKNTTRELQDKEKRLNASLGSMLTEKTRLQNDLDELTLAHGKLSEEHATVKKTHDTEIHGLKRNADVADTERQLLQDRIDELVSQNQELAKTVASRLRANQVGHDEGIVPLSEETARSFDLSDDSPPPSPTKATPRPGGLESETLRSSLHHAHRMIQNLKGNIHREKTEKIELKRMLQEARDELEQKRGGDGSALKRQKTKPEAFKKPARPDMLGGGRKARTDVELTDDDWEDHHGDTPTNLRSANLLRPTDQSHHRLTDVSDAYHTADDTDGVFDTADEHNTTESEAFMTGAESMAGDSSDELTETEDTASRTNSHRPAGVARNLRAGTTLGDPPFTRSSLPSTANGLEDTQTPNKSSFAKGALLNRSGQGRQFSLASVNTPESLRTSSVSNDSPATVTTGQSPYAGEQTLFSELEDMGELNSDTQSTPARSTLSSQQSTPGIMATPSKSYVPTVPLSIPRPVMVDSSMMTEPWAPDMTSTGQDPNVGNSGLVIGSQVNNGVDTPRKLLPAAELPLPPSVPVSPIRKMDNSTQYTPQRGLADSPVRPGSSYITPPKTVWDEAHEPGTPSPAIQNRSEIRTEPALGFSSVMSNDTEPGPDVASKLEHSHRPLAFSSVSSHDIEPVTPSYAAGLPSVHDEVTTAPGSPRTPERAPREVHESSAEKVVGGGSLASAAAMLGFAAAKHGEDSQATQGAQNSVSHAPATVDTATSPMRTDTERVLAGDSDHDSFARKQKAISCNDQAAQTLLTAEELDEALRRRETSPDVTSASQTEANAMKRRANSPSLVIARPASRNRETVTIDEDSSVIGPLPTLQRPGSASSNRPSSVVSQQYPPLPPDHKDVIARANTQLGSPTKRDSSSNKVGGIMGPPILPASAMRRSKTPNESVRSSVRDSRNTGKRGTVSSQASRRSSVSSFASELDERFNIRPSTQSGGLGYESGPDTDPRMIQAITQTMIGEYLWKYTRKTGSKEMSSTRHRRYFWVHPYTKTLYWSEHDPQTAGRNELKAKSVAIQSVRVVSDDNPMPPGLHRKSLEIITPGRVVKFTASTGQRHETWFNALSYLLYRGEGEGSKNVYAPNGTEITGDDLAEFSVGNYGARLVPNDGRTSMSSYNSRDTSRNRANRQSLPTGMTTFSSRDASKTGLQSSSIQDNNDTVRRSRADQGQTSGQDRTVRSNSMVRISNIIGSVTGRTRSDVRPGQPQSRENSSIYDASIVSEDRKDDSEEAARRQKQQSTNTGLEDVRACCDGKHNVSTLTHRHNSTSNTQHRVSNAINRSMSRRF